jgi:glutamate dehydrogenase (NAD(P)+)
VSYFEWLKDLEHVRFGRLEKRFEEHAFRRLLGAVESATERKFSQDMLTSLAQGADERDLVYSGLEETMCYAYREIHGIQQKYGRKIDLRTASFIDAIDKIAAAYDHMGIFP